MIDCGNRKGLKNARRTLILCAKLFQALANDNVFDSPAMAACSTFIIDNRDKFDQFTSKVLQVNSLFKK